MSPKGLTFRNTLALLAGAGMASLFAACGVDYHWGGEIDPYAQCLDTSWEPYHSLGCSLRRCALDAGIPEDNCDDGGASSSSGSSARCSGTCVRNAPINFDAPRPVYVGSPAKYLFGCPPEIGATGGRYFSGFHVPDPGCPTCVCDSPEGSCSTKSNALFVHANFCGEPQVDTLDFDGPPNWDGSCTNINAVPQGAECPSGSGVFCSQSIQSSEMLEAVETCKPIALPVPKFTGDYPWWDDMVLACSSSVLPGECSEAASTTCLPSVPSDEPEWTYCVRRPGVHLCPSEFDSVYTKQVIAYPRMGYTDTTTCTACTCTPTGGACFGTLRVYSDDSCSTNEIMNHVVGSAMTNCENLSPFGDALGSKEITDVVYVPGECVPSGGEPIGSVELHDDEAATWCCIP